MATSLEAGNGSTASIAKGFTVTVLPGNACATPTGLNPYVSFANTQCLISTQMLTPVSGGLVVSGLTPVGTTNPILVNAFQKPDLDLETAMEDAFLNLSDAIGAALQAQLRKEVGG